MRSELLPKAFFAGLGLGVAGYFVLGMYSQSLHTYSKIEPVRAFLNHALARDSAGLASQAGSEQPIQWVLAAMSQDSGAVQEWAESRPRVTSFRGGDTVWVTLRRPGSTESCSPQYPLTAGFLEERGHLRLVHLSSLCPRLSQAGR